MSKNAEDLFQMLEKLGVEARSFDHPPLFTVEESRALRGLIEGLHSKNLFLRDRARRFFLVVAEEEAKIDLKTLHMRIGAQGKVSFGSAEVMLELLGVTPGSVTPFGVINDEGGQVAVVLDSRLAEAPAVNFHPLTNTRTTTLAGPDLLRFLRACGHEPLLLSFGEACGEA